MDSIFDRAHDLIDKAQEKVATATSQAAWAANQALVIKNLEGQLNALQDEITRVTSDVGERTYQAWKARTDDPRIPGLCAHLDDLKNRRMQVSADLDAARAATYDPQAVQTAWQASQQRLATVLPPPQAPAIAPPQAPVVQAPPAVVPRPAPPPPPRPTPVPQAAPPPRQSAPAPAAPQARECPNCGQFVPAGVEYCPACGLRVT